MCEFCIQHGEGKVWYLAMQNYSQELLHEENRERYITEFVVNFEKNAAASLALFDRVNRIPFLRGLAKRVAEYQQKKTHFGQILPVEDAIQVIEFADAVVRLPCICRSLTIGKQNERYCYALTFDPLKSLETYPDFAGAFERLEKREAQAQIENLDRKGLVHSIWTFKTPYIGAICNCDQDCLAYRVQMMAKLLKVMFRAEYVGAVDLGKCNGCRNCQRQCQFGAIQYSASTERCSIDMQLCYGCGVCRAVCAKDAITLRSRQEIPVLKGVW